MKLIIIRHGDPDYEHDTLTPKGVREAKLLSERISKLDVKAFYCSPLGNLSQQETYFKPDKIFPSNSQSQGSV